VTGSVPLGRDGITSADGGGAPGRECADGCCAPVPTATPPAAAPSWGSVGENRRGRRRVRMLTAASITYNLVEAIVAISVGAAASSTALVGFGLDSVIEVASAAAVAWQFSATDPQARERAALKVIACSFFALAAYVTVDSVRGHRARGHRGRGRRACGGRGGPGRSGGGGRGCWLGPDRYRCAPVSLHLHRPVFAVHPGRGVGASRLPRVLSCRCGS